MSPEVNRAPEEALSPDEKRRRLDASLAGGVAWTAGAKWATQIFTWASLLITARLLTQADFGIGEMAGAFVALTNIMAEFGVGTTALHMNELDEHKLHQLHGFSLLLCTGIYLFSLLVSPLIALFFHQPGLTPVIAVNNIAFFITGFQAVPMGLLQRDMDFRRLSLSEGASNLFQALVTVVLAWLGWGYWALVLGVLGSKLMTALLVGFWKPVSFAWPRWSDLRGPLQFGRQASMTQLAWAAYLHSDMIIVGRSLGDAALGTYRMAMNLATAPAEKISMLIMRTAGPLFANLQNENHLVKRYFLALAETLNLVIVPAMVGIVMVAPDAVVVILGPKWAAVTGPLILLSGYMIVATMNSLITQVLVSQRQTRFTMRMSVINMVVMPISFWIGARLYGIVGVAGAWLLVQPSLAVIPAVVLLRRIGLRWTEYLRAIAPTLIGAGIMAIALAAIRYRIAPLGWSSQIKLAIQVIAGACVYTVVLVGFFREKVWRYIRFAQNLRSSRAAADANT